MSSSQFIHFDCKFQQAKKVCSVAQPRFSKKKSWKGGQKLKFKKTFFHFCQRSFLFFYLAKKHGFALSRGRWIMAPLANPLGNAIDFVLLGSIFGFTRKMKWTGKRQKTEKQLKPIRYSVLRRNIRPSERVFRWISFEVKNRRWNSCIFLSLNLFRCMSVFEGKPQNGKSFITITFDPLQFFIDYIAIPFSFLSCLCEIRLHTSYQYQM